MLNNIIAGKTNEEIKKTPQALSFFFYNVWNFLKMGDLMEKVGIKKRNGVSAEDVSFIYSLFGAMDSKSIIDLSRHIKEDILLKTILAARSIQKDINNKVINRLLNSIGIEKYDSLLDEVIKASQTDPRTKSVSEGVVIGDDTNILKSGKKMENISVVYDHSKGEFGLGYCLPTTYYADDVKDHPLFFGFRLKSDEEKKAAEEKKLKKELKIDMRSPRDVLKWVDNQIASEDNPPIVTLRGSSFNPSTVNELEQRGIINWLGISAKNRIFTISNSKMNVKKIISSAVESEYTVMEEDENHRLIIKKGEMKGVGKVNILIVNNIEEDITKVCVTRDIDENKSIDLLTIALDHEKEDDETKLKLMLKQYARARECGIVAKNATLDRWYYVPWFINELIKLGYERVVIKTKKNMLYLHGGEKMIPEDIKKTIPREDYAYHEKENVRLASRVVSQTGIDNEKIKLVFVEELNTKGKVTQSYSLMCTDSDCENIKVFHIHKKRWKIEVFYRTAKQCLCLGAFHMRNFNGIYGHVFFVFLTSIIFTLLYLFNPKIVDKTFGWIKREYLRTLVKIKKVKNKICVKFMNSFLQSFGLPVFDT